MTHLGNSRYCPNLNSSQLISKILEKRQKERKRVREKRQRIEVGEKPREKGERKKQRDEKMGKNY